MSCRNRSVAGKMMILEGLILLAPLLILPFYLKELGIVWIYVIPALSSILLGAVVCMLQLQIRDSSRLVVFAWVYGMLLAAIPFYLYGGLTPVQALFESVSGFTTTGLSVLDVEQLPALMLFYRAFLQYVGGVGFVVTMLLFIQEKDSVVLYQAEGHTDRLMPNIGKTARVIGVMYIFFLIVGTIVLTILGMPLLDSVVHTMCALSTGGFSNRLDSIGYYNSLPIELVTIVLMLIGTTNFSLLLLLFKGRIGEFLRASEIRFMGGLIVLMVPIMTLCLADVNGVGLARALRLSVFNAISAISTTGYATCSYADWPQLPVAMMIIMMIIGGGMGSTAGGIKLARICIILKELVRNVRRKLVSDRRVLLAYYHKGTEKELLENDRIEEATTYAVSYIIIYLAGAFLLTIFSGCTLMQGAFEFASSIGTVGLSIGITNATMGSASLIIEIIGMVLGRLEIFVIIKALCAK